MKAKPGPKKEQIAAALDRLYASEVQRVLEGRPRARAARSGAVAGGWTTTEFARELGVSPWAVTLMIRQALKKLARQIAPVAAEHGWAYGGRLPVPAVRPVRRVALGRRQLQEISAAADRVLCRSRRAA